MSLIVLRLTRVLSTIGLLTSAGLLVAQPAGAQNTITCGATVTAMLSGASDTDSYQFAGTIGQVLSITIGGGDEGWVPCWTLLGPTQSQVGEQGCSGGGFPRQVEYQLAATGTYTVNVFQAADAAGTYHLTLEEVSDRLPACSATIPCGETVTATLDVDGDTDTYEFSGNAGDVLSVTIGGGGDGWVACSQLFDPDGGAIGDVVCTGGGPPRQREYTLDVGGDHTFKVFQTVGTGTYHLTVEEVSDRRPECSATIACGETATGTLVVDGDTHAYQFNGSPGDVVSLTIGGGDEGWVACSQLFDPDGGVIGDVVCTGGGSPRQREYTLQVAGDHTVKVFQTIGTGTYHLTLEEVSDQLLDCSATIGCGATVADMLDVDGDTNTYRFEGDAGEMVSVGIAGGDEGWVACWQLFDPDGGAVGDVGCTGGAFPQQIQYELPTSGTYTIKVFQTVGADVYLLTLNSDPPCATPTPTSSSTPGNGDTTRTRTPTPTRTATVTATPTPTRTPTPAIPTPTPTASVASTPTATTSENATPTSTFTPEATPVEIATLTATPTPTTTSTTTPTTTPTGTRTPTPAPTGVAGPNSCDAGKILCVNKKQACLLKEHGRAEKNGELPDAAKLQKCTDKFDGGSKGFAKSCIGKLEGKQDPEKPRTVCSVTGDLLSLEGKVDAFVTDVVSEIHPGFPSAGPASSCDAGKKKCIARKTSCLLKGHSRAEKKGELPDATKLQKCTDKFDGGSKGFAKGCIGRLEGKQNPDKPKTLCSVTGDLVALESKVDAFVLDVVSEIRNVP